MINVQNVVEERLQEKVIFVTSYEPEKIYFLVVTKEGRTFSTFVSIPELQDQILHNYPLQRAADFLAQSVIDARKLAQAKLDIERAERVIARLENKG